MTENKMGHILLEVEFCADQKNLWHYVLKSNVKEVIDGLAVGYRRGIICLKSIFLLGILLTRKSNYLRKNTIKITLKIAKLT